MHDTVLAVYFNYSYAGETVQKLVKVFCQDEAIPEEYMHWTYTIKAMKLVDLVEGEI
jgi:hypothetical protein